LKCREITVPGKTMRVCPREEGDGTGEREVISFLLFNADQLNINSMDFSSLTVSGFVPPRHGLPPRISMYASGVQG
jgi:hypothetical protein